MIRRRIYVEYCLGAGDGFATIWTGTPDIDLDGDGEFDALRLDFDGDGRLDDALADLDGDGAADHAALDLDDDGTAESYFTDDGSGTWAIPVDRGGLGAPPARGAMRWFGLDGVEHSGGPLVDFDADGQIDDEVIDSDADGLADRVVCETTSGAVGYLDVDGDGRWDVELADTDGDGSADTATDV
jgi:hypothetical protein